MKIKEIIETIKYIKSSVIEDFKTEYKRAPTNNIELLDHLKEIYKNGNLLNTEEFEKVEGDKNEGNKS